VLKEGLDQQRAIARVLGQGHALEFAGAHVEPDRGCVELDVGYCSKATRWSASSQTGCPGAVMLARLPGGSQKTRGSSAPAATSKSVTAGGE
jgi:hypothetical protein